MCYRQVTFFVCPTDMLQKSIIITLYITLSFDFLQIITKTGLSGLHAEAIRELEAMRQSYRQIDFAIITALIWLHRQSVVTDEDELERLELMLKAARDCVYIDGALLASRFHLNTGSLEDTLLCLKLKAFQRPNIDSNKEVEAEKARIRLWLRLCCTEYHDYNPASDLIVLKNEIINGNYDIDSLMVQTE